MGKKKKKISQFFCFCLSTHLSGMFSGETLLSAKCCQPNNLTWVIMSRDLIRGQSHQYEAPVWLIWATQSPAPLLWELKLTVWLQSLRHRESGVLRQSYASTNCRPRPETSVIQRKLSSTILQGPQRSGQGPWKILGISGFEKLGPAELTLSRTDE